MTTYAMLRDSRELSRVLPMVTEAADNVGDPAVQARGTLGGRWRTPIPPPISPPSSWR